MTKNTGNIKNTGNGIYWIILLASALLEAVWATALGLSNGFSQLTPTVVFAITAVLSMLGLGYRGEANPPRHSLRSVGWYRSCADRWLGHAHWRGIRESVEAAVHRRNRGLCCRFEGPAR